VGLAILALFTHPLLDVFTSYGTQLFAPFSRRRFALDAVGIIDPAYTLLLGVAVAVGLWRGVGSKAARRAAVVALLLSSTYLVAGLEVNRRAEESARAQLRAEGVVGATVDAYPTVLQLPLRRIVARDGGVVRVGWWSLLAPRPIAWTRFEVADGPAVRAAKQTWEASVLEWFAMGQTAARIERTNEGVVVEIDDLRYGLPGHPRDGLWGVRIRLDAAGQPVGSGERINRMPRAEPGQLLRELWRRTLGLSAP
jgi:inner membrane protein